MSDYDPSRPQIGQGYQQSPFEAEMMPPGDGPMSGMAVAGFVSSLILCCPVLSPLLGLLFSSIGLVQTRQGLRRGRGLAIAGLIISLLGFPLQGIVGFAGYTALKVPVQSSIFVSVVFTADDETAGSAAVDLYQVCSEEFQSQVPQDKFVAWVAAKRKALGRAQEVIPGPQQQVPGGIKITMDCKMTDRSVPVTLDFAATSMWQISLRDFSIDGESALEKLGEK